MASIYARGEKLWMRLKNEHGRWVSERCSDYEVGQEAEARRYAAAAQRAIDAKRKLAGDGPLTVERFATAWLAEREKRGLRAIADDKGRITNHVVRLLGPKKLDEVRPRDIRDMVRELCKQIAKGELAPRTVRHIYGVMRTMFHDAMVDEVISSNPCVLKRGELPGKTDKDPEWRNAATYTLDEVKLLVTSELIPHRRRVEYALKALAGLRHGEVAGLRWRHYDSCAEPLPRLLIATSYDTGRTKTEVTRRVPVHPALKSMLATWREAWTDVYGLTPKVTDLVVPTSEMTPVAAADAVHALKHDLLELELRVDAGEHRDRGGHDLRAWFITSCQEAGAHRDLLRVITHTSRSDVMAGYTRATWPALCAEVSKLRFEVDA